MSNNWKRSIAGFVLLVMMMTFLPTNVVQAATYKKGSKGTNVQYLQQNLAFLGCSPGSADGSYGAKTVAAVKALQKMLHLEETGVVDNELDALIKGTVRDVQIYLQKKGYYSGELDGIKGSMMATGYKKLQKELGYKQTGVLELEVAKVIMSDGSCVGTLSNLQEFIKRCDGLYVDNSADFMSQIAECIEKLELVSKEGIAPTNITSDLFMKISEVSTQNGVWRLDSQPKIKDAVKYSADLLLALYNSIMSENMRLHKLQEIKSVQVEECQVLINKLFNEAYQSLDNMKKYNKISSKNRERAGNISELLKEYQEYLPDCQEVFAYAVELLKTDGGSNIYMHNGIAYFVCENFDKKYVYNQNAYDKFVKPGRGNVGCTATALAISYSIYNNMFVMPDNKEIRWNDEKYTMLYPWTPHMSHDAAYCDISNSRESSTDDRLEYIYDNYVVTDIPVVIRLERVKDPQDGNNGHSVVVIGICIDADVENLTYDDFLVADPNNAKIHTLTESMGNGKYQLSSGWHLAYPNEAN